MPDKRRLDDHELESVETVARLHRKHDENASRLQLGIDAVTDAIGRPASAVLFILLFLAGAAVAAVQSGGRLDQPPAYWVHLAATLTALILGVLILASQRRSDAFAARRAAMTLDLALLADRKNAKIVELLEAIQRDAPQLPNADDAEADEMATPVDPKALVHAIDRSVDGESR